MVEAKHTSGPWDVCYDHPCPVTNPRVAYIRGNGPDRHYAEIAMLYCCDGDEQRANARLIAAAPEMLAALHESAQFIARYTSGRGTDDLLNTIHAAIAKAKDER